MKRFLCGIALTGLVLSLTAGVAHAQLGNMPVFFSPAFGTGVGVYGDFGIGLNDDAKLSDPVTGAIIGDAPVAFGGHVILGLSKFQIMGGVSYVDPKDTTGTPLDKELTYGGNVALTLFRTPASMIVVNVQAGAGYAKFGEVGSEVKQWNFPIGVGIALDLPVVGWFVEPWVAPRVHIYSTSGDLLTDSQTDVGFGVSGGVNFNLLLGIGAWAALDWQSVKFDDTPGAESVKPLVLGAGLSWKFSVPGLGVAGGLVGG
jgi:hypothetical protein